MINNLTIQNFKAFELQSFSLKNLNIFTGINGVGKSSALQSLLLLRQSFLKNKLESLVLNHEDYVSIGTGKDALYSGVLNEFAPIGFYFNDSKEKNQFLFDYLRESDKEELEKKQIERMGTLRLNSSSEFNPSFFDQPLFKSDNLFQYLPAERIGPEDENEMSSEYVIERKELGPKGKFSLDYFESYKTTQLDNPYILHPRTLLDVSGSNSLGVQTNLWLNEITPGTKLSTYEIKEIRKIRGAFSFQQNDGYGPEYKTKNVGFGLTYVLPVILALLTTKPGGMVIIENPESHLHPAGQSKMAELIARCAASGVQVFVETHSDHIINGIMVAAYEHYKEKKKENPDKTIGISNEDVAIYYFSREEGRNYSDVERINLTETGRIKKPPRKFFDQFDLDLRRLL
ncbi:MAG TPA: DUF3696 domain-containing protein [Leptospiraceae bacterium]|nr:DUF3696 domain-containing protein [Leptospiraceae bacterium]HMW05254.1 DUF3696 domain-containing protein [Leptospiraceae bacterium]HMX31281.1 DUF3696 domain-containing protein [Leptospiraceae bacterium]HMY32087.1 DUF3696 domain-containing protein [Leptospiraceae bacterium]HMZ64696.1 DUF3696 domain-containing protein [Leptospiraceae bacterium]